ncbi:hypothetical protein Bca101_057592 [Brassica carinata]
MDSEGEAEENTTHPDLECVPNDDQGGQEEPEPLDQYSTCYGSKSQLIYNTIIHPIMRKVMWRILWSSLSKENEDHSGCTSKTLPWDSVKTCSKQTMEPHNGDQIYQNRLDAPSIYFSGHKQGPSAYLKWEDDTEKWFIAWRIPEKLKPTYAVDTLTGEAYKWWSQLDADRIYFNDPAYTLKEVKIVMYTDQGKVIASLSVISDQSNHQGVPELDLLRPPTVKPNDREGVFQVTDLKPEITPSITLVHLIFSLSAKEETGTLGVNKDQEKHKEDVVKIATTSDQTYVSDHLIQSVYHDSKDVIKHLIFPEELGKVIGTMENQQEPYSQPCTEPRAK